MYLVRRAFKSCGEFYGVGTVITDPSTIKLFRSKLSEGKIIEIQQGQGEHMIVFFKDKLGVELPEEVQTFLKPKVAPAATVQAKATVVQTKATPAKPATTK